jgi:hypothetical protein
VDAAEDGRGIELFVDCRFQHLAFRSALGNCLAHGGGRGSGNHGGELGFGFGLELEQQLAFFLVGQIDIGQLDFELARLVERQDANVVALLREVLVLPFDGLLLPGTFVTIGPPLPVQVEEGKPDEIAAFALRCFLDEPFADAVNPPEGKKDETADADTEQPAAFRLQIALAEHALEAAITAHRPFAREESCSILILSRRGVCH